MVLSVYVFAFLIFSLCEFLAMKGLYLCIIVWLVSLFKSGMVSARFFWGDL